MVGRQSELYYSSEKHQFTKAKANATKRGLIWNLSMETWQNLRKLPCHYCGHPIDTKGSGLDRLDNCIGYLEGNIVSCCFICNTARSSIWTPEEMKIIGTVMGQLIKLRKSPVTDPILPARHRPKTKEAS